MERWSILIEKEYLKFSCAHFLIFPDGSKERLHGHNYQVVAEVDGNLSEFGLVIDFKMVKPIIKALCDELDEHWLIPGQHRELTWRHRDDGHTEVAQTKHGTSSVTIDEHICGLDVAMDDAVVMQVCGPGRDLDCNIKKL